MNAAQPKPQGRPPAFNHNAKSLCATDETLQVGVRLRSQIAADHPSGAITSTARTRERATSRAPRRAYLPFLGERSSHVSRDAPAESAVADPGA